jgi:hypothetical protein
MMRWRSSEAQAFGARIGFQSAFQVAIPANSAGEKADEEDSHENREQQGRPPSGTGGDIGEGAFGVEEDGDEPGGFAERLGL